ncbi:MAG TPA: hypothetical protein PKY25_01175 [Bacilli bacterium]|nr:hypothetical protein [Bacilli bacterium]
MLEIEKSKGERGYSLIITTEDGSFKISFEGNLDLYWTNLYKGSLLDQPESKSFTITKENYYLYLLFERLYEDVKKCNIYKADKYDILFYEDASVVRIVKKEDVFVVTIEKSKEENMYQTYSVRFRNSGSRYCPYNVVFMKMHNELIDYNPEYHQIHFEEIIYKNSLVKKKP